MGVTTRVLGKRDYSCSRLPIEQERRSVVLIRVVGIGGLAVFAQVIGSSSHNGKIEVAGVSRFCYVTCE